mmetsp:Transcript_37964/g.80799  ORF Transcript_37964/g.80799 Transcript_37964/m.80799 type:complete len:213 (-) Transcript_37964:269-907(-)
MIEAEDILLLDEPVCEITFLRWLSTAYVRALVVGLDRHPAVLDEEGEVKEVLDRLREGGWVQDELEEIDPAPVPVLARDLGHLRLHHLHARRLRLLLRLLLQLLHRHRIRRLHRLARHPLLALALLFLLWGGGNKLAHHKRDSGHVHVHAQLIYRFGEPLPIDPCAIGIAAHAYRKFAFQLPDEGFPSLVEVACLSSTELGNSLQDACVERG